MPRSYPLVGTLAVMALSACGGGGDNVTEPITGRPTNSVSIVARAETKGSSAFSPSPLTVSLASGGVVHWFNDDKVAAGGQYGGSTGTTHTISGDDLSFLSGNVTPGLSFEHTFTVAGTYSYHCSIHPTMQGTITVTP
jgi:plastocyanin